MTCLQGRATAMFGDLFTWEFRHAAKMRSKFRQICTCLLEQNRSDNGKAISHPRAVAPPCSELELFFWSKLEG